MHTDPVTGLPVSDPTDSLAPGIVPGQVASTETEGTSVSRGGLTPDAQVRLNAGRTVDQAASADAIANAQQAGQLAEQRARIEEEKVNRTAAVNAEYNQRRLTALDNADKDIQAARAAHKQAFDDYRKMEIGDFFSDTNAATGKQEKNWGRIISAAITVGLGGLMQRSNGGRNTALEQLDKTMDMYFAREREKILKARDIAAETKGNIADVASNQAASLKALDIKEAAARSKVADEMATRLAALGVPQAQVESAKPVIEQRQKAAEKLQKVDESERTHIVSTHTKALQQPGSGMVFGPGGKPLFDVGDKAVAADVNKANKNYTELNQLLGELKTSYGKGVAIPLMSDEANRRDALLSRLKILMKDQAQLGALSGSDMDLMNQQLGGGFTKLTGAGGATKIGEVQKMIDQSHVNYLDSRGAAGSKVIDVFRTPSGGEQPSAPAPAAVAVPTRAASPAPVAPDVATKKAAAKRVYFDRGAPIEARKAARRFLDENGGP